jgi:hypothetical protein
MKVLHPEILINHLETLRPRRLAQSIASYSLLASNLRFLRQQKARGLSLTHSEEKIMDTSVSLEARRYAVLADTHFEQADLIEPAKELEGVLAQVDVVSSRAGGMQGMRHDQRETRGRRKRTDRR